MRRLIYILLTILTAMLNCSAMDVTFSGATPQFHYHNQDHLGNNREVISESGVLEQVTHYYPFGGPFCERTTAGANTNATLQRYKYNGKELDLMHGLKWYDYGARMYDPTLLTWNAIDPMAEKNPGISSYCFCQGNPVNRIDPDGRDDYYTQDGEFLYRDHKDTDRIIIRNTYAEEINRIAPTEWHVIDTPIEKTVLSAKAYSNIFTNILSQMEDVNIEELHNQKVSVTVWQSSEDNIGMYTSDRYNDAGKAGGTLAETGKLQNGDRVVTCYIYPQGTKEKSIVNTVSNVQNLLGAHEYLGHYKNGWKSHSYVFPFQRNHKTWDKTTIEYKNYLNDVYEK